MKCSIHNRTFVISCLDCIILESQPASMTPKSPYQNRIQVIDHSKMKEDKNGNKIPTVYTTNKVRRSFT